MGFDLGLASSKSWYPFLSSYRKLVKKDVLTSP